MSSTKPYPPKTSHTIPARSGVAVPLQSDQIIRVINTHGTQVIDFWAFSKDTLTIHLSLSHTRTSTLHLCPHVNDIIRTNSRQPILQLIADTTPGAHDTLIAACDLTRYKQLTNNESTPDYYHDNCADNLRNALRRDVNQVFPEGMSTPDPLNLFMNIPVHLSRNTSGNDRAKGTVAGSELSFEAPVSEKGQSVTFRALMDCIVVMSACPQDLVKVNDMEPREAHFIIDE